MSDFDSLDLDFLTYGEELGALEDEGKRGRKLTLYISMDNHKSGINLQEDGNAHSPTHRKTFSYHDQCGLSTVAV